ncbi:ribonuclease HII [Rappaport israeli]|uniref:ribonuclease HII n=1 Tax=Rappaport israeli TaxID=1839807 RepID=UPI000930DFB5|nr:ribonuclease HII [Rappaport israeli]
MIVAGVDEAGRGALVGNVVAAAVVLPKRYDLPKLTDSKRLTARQRERLFEGIMAQASAVCWAQVGALEIDRLNIHHASLLAMRRAVLGLRCLPDKVLVDGRFVPDVPMVCEAIVGGDGLEASIAAASIVAKVVRDAQMVALDACWPQYGYARHKGYPSALHVQALARFGVHGLYRLSYRPVRALLSGLVFEDKKNG